MPPPNPFKHHAFLSYSSADRPWAKQLADALSQRNLDIFWDRKDLVVGENWDEQLDASLAQSQHLIVLWSKSAEQKRFVDYERTYFHVKARDSRNDAQAPARKEIVILLEDPPPIVRNTIQMIPDLKEIGAYAAGIENRDANTWASVVDQVDKTARDRSNALRILVAVLATNKRFLNDLDFGREFNFMGNMNDVIAQIGIASKGDLLNYYGDSVDEWCPFGNNANIWTVLDSLKVRVLNATDNRIQIDWEPIGIDLWSTTDLAAAKRQAARLVKELSLVIIDPISLVDEHVKDILDLIQGCFNNAKSAVMVLTPFSMLRPSAALRNIIQSRAMPFSSLFYEPPVPPSSPFANFGVNIGDEIDMNRLILMTLGQYFGDQKPRNVLINP